jgi:hypothetical protein
MTTVHHRYATVGGHQLFYREAGPDDAPDHLGFGLSDAPPAGQFGYTFDALAGLTNDEIFGPDGARAFAADAPDAEIHLLDGRHFLLESQLDTAAAYIRGFLGRTLS